MDIILINKLMIKLLIIRDLMSKSIDFEAKCEVE